MKLFFKFTVFLALLIGISYAQPKARLWYGSKMGVREILQSPFCEKYKCQLSATLDYRKISKHTNFTFVLDTKYGDGLLAKAIGNGTGKISLITSTNKGNQIDFIKVYFGDGFGPPPYTSLNAVSAEYLRDVVFYALGKKYLFVRPTGDANPTDDMNVKCMNGIDISKKVFRILEQGNVRFEGETRLRPYVAYCMLRPSKKNPNEWPIENMQLFQISDRVYVPQ